MWWLWTLPMLLEEPCPFQIPNLLSSPCPALLSFPCLRQEPLAGFGTSGLPLWSDHKTFWFIYLEVWSLARSLAHSFAHSLIHSLHGMWHGWQMGSQCSTTFPGTQESWMKPFLQPAAEAGQLINWLNNFPISYQSSWCLSQILPNCRQLLGPRLQSGNSRRSSAPRVCTIPKSSCWVLFTA